MGDDEFMVKDIMIQSIISEEDRKNIYKILFIGVSAYSRVLESNKDLISSKAFIEIKTRLLSFVIKRQFDDDMLSYDFPYKVDFKGVNNFGNKALMLKNKSVKLQINKTSKKGSLYNSNKPSQYMKKEAESNSIYSRQIKFFIDYNDELGVKEDSRTYVILGYGVNENKVEHLDFIIPSEDMKGHVDYFNGLEEYNDLIMGVSTNDETEERIMALKEEALKIIK
jgi:hypothetical protein